MIEIPERVLAARSITIFPDDTFIVSYPRSGNTWLRFLVGNLIHPVQPASFANIETYIPDIYRNRDAELLTVTRPRILKSHEYANEAYQNVIYIIRDPRDVAVSYYYYHLKQRWLEDGYGIDHFVQDFIDGDLLYGKWDIHVLGWLQLCEESSQFLLLRYETLLAQLEQEVRRIVDFLGVRGTPQDIVQAVSLSSAENMRNLEHEQSTVWRTTSQSRQDIPFVRGARAGEWQAELPAASAALINSAWGDLMRSFHYV